MSSKFEIQSLTKKCVFFFFSFSKTNIRNLVLHFQALGVNSDINFKLKNYFFNIIIVILTNVLKF